MITKTRSIAKSITWRLIAIAVTFIVGFAMTGNWQFAASLSLLSNFINFVLYYIHERFWLQIRWGKK